MCLSTFLAYFKFSKWYFYFTHNLFNNPSHTKIHNVDPILTNSDGQWTESIEMLWSKCVICIYTSFSVCVNKMVCWSHPQNSMHLNTFFFHSLIKNEKLKSSTILCDFIKLFYPFESSNSMWMCTIGIYEK